MADAKKPEPAKAPAPAVMPKPIPPAPAPKAARPVVFDGKAPAVLVISDIPVFVADATVAEQTKRNAVNPTGAELYSWTAKIKGNECGSLTPVTAAELVPSVSGYIKNAMA